MVTTRRLSDFLRDEPKCITFTFSISYPEGMVNVGLQPANQYYQIPFQADDNTTDQTVYEAVKEHLSQRFPGVVDINGTVLVYGDFNTEKWENGQLLS